MPGKRVGVVPWRHDPTASMQDVNQRPPTMQDVYSRANAPGTALVRTRFSWAGGSDVAAATSLVAEAVAVIRFDHGDQRSGSLADRPAAQLGHVVLGNDLVDRVLQHRDDAAGGELGDDQAHRCTMTSSIATSPPQHRT